MEKSGKNALILAAGLIAGAILFVSAGSAYALSTFIVQQGGTGTSSPSGILYGDNGTTSHLNTVQIGSNLTFSAGILSATGGGGSGTISTSSPLISGQPLYATGLSTIASIASSTFLTSLGGQVAGNYITALTGDITASGPGSTAATLATVNGNVGSFTNANITVNAKGLITAAANGIAGSSFAYLFPNNATSTLLNFFGNASTSQFTSTSTTYLATKAGQVFVGTTTDSYGVGAALTVDGLRNNAGIFAVTTGGAAATFQDNLNGIGVEGVTLTSGQGVFGSSGNLGIGVEGTASGTGVGVLGITSGGIGGEFTDIGGGTALKSLQGNVLLNTSSGFTGIGSTTPGSLLSIGTTGGINFNANATSTFQNGIHALDFCTSTRCLSSVSSAPGGASSTIQYNANGAFAGNTGLVYTGTNLGLGIAAPTAQLYIQGITPAPVSAVSGGTAQDALTIVGGPGAANSSNGSAASGGKGGGVDITGGTGGAITGTPTVGTGGTGADINLQAGAGGTGTTFGGSGGGVTISGGLNGFGTSPGTPGFVSLKGGNAQFGNQNGADVYLIGGIPSGTGVRGNVYLNESPSLTVSGKTAIGSSLTPVSQLDVGNNVSIGSYAGNFAAPSNGLAVSGFTGIGTSSPMSQLSVAGSINQYGSGFNHFGTVSSIDPFYCTSANQCLVNAGSDNTLNGVEIEDQNASPGAHAYAVYTLQNNLTDNTGTHYASWSLNGNGYNDSSFGTALNFPNLSQFLNTDGATVFGTNLNATTTANSNYFSWIEGGSSTSNELMHLNPTGLGIGTSSPFARLSVNGSSLGTMPLFSVASSSAAATTTVFQIDNLGNLTSAGEFSINDTTFTSRNALSISETMPAGVAGISSSATAANIQITYAGASANQKVRGLSVLSAFTGTVNNTATNSGQFPGGANGAIYTSANNSTGINLANSIALAATVQVNNGGGSFASTTNGIAVSATSPTVASTSLLTNYYGYKVAGATSEAGIITNGAGLNIESLLLTATNTTEILLGTASIPSGNYGIYQSDTLNDYLAGKLGIGSTTPQASLTVVAASSTVPTTAYTGLVSIIAGFENTTVKLFQEIDQWGHLITSGDTPSVSGGTSSVSGNDNNGNITVTGTLLTSVTLTFAHAWASAPDCQESDSSTAITADISSISATQVVFGFSAGVSTGTVWYSCKGHI